MITDILLWRLSNPFAPHILGLIFLGLASITIAIKILRDDNKPTYTLFPYILFIGSFIIGLHELVFQMFYIPYIFLTQHNNFMTIIFGDSLINFKYLTDIGLVIIPYFAIKKRLHFNLKSFTPFFIFIYIWIILLQFPITTQYPTSLYVNGLEITYTGLFSFGMVYNIQ